MSTKIEVFIHSQGAKPKKITAETHERLHDVLSQAGLPGLGDLVFLGESSEALDEADDVDNGEDSHEPVNAELTLEHLHLRDHGGHVHSHKCRRIMVTVNYGGGSKHHKFSPATTIEVVTRWAKKKFKLDDQAAADLVLQITGTKDIPRANQHLGEIVASGRCDVSFDLVKETTPQG